MASTCPNGHVNDAGNRFCDQCGLPLQAAAAAPEPTSSPAAMSPASAVCPVCGQENVPGTAFCDNCGAALPPPQPVEASVEQGTSATQAAHTEGADTITCSQCGTANDPANRFCENCGATLAQADQPAGDEMQAPGAEAQPELVDAVDAAPIQPSGELTDSTALPTEGVAPPVLTDSVQAESPAEQPETTTQAAAPQTSAQDTNAERERLEKEIETQRQLVSQLEQMEAQFGAAMPPALRQGLDEARQRLSQAEHDLQALGVTAHPLPTALDVAQQRADTQTQQPDEASSAPAAEAAPVQQEAPAQPQADQQAAVPQAQPQPTQQPQAQPSQPAPAAPARGTDQLPPAGAPAQASGPRLVLRDGSSVSLPSGGREIVVGREDPISGIHPDVDLTPHGGEAGGVSRRHAVLQQQGGQWLLTDLDSTNYTHIDGNRLAANTPTPVPDGARLRFGRVEVEFHAS